MIYFEVNQTQTANYGLPVRAVRRVLKGTWDAIGLHWQKEFLPRHFKIGAAARYGYKDRTRKTIIRKMKLAAKGKVAKSGRVDLVWSGVMERALTGFRQRQSAYPTRVTIHLAGPSYLKINYKPNRPHLAQEVLAVSGDERQALTQTGHDEMFKLLEWEAKRNATSKRIKAK